MTRQGKNKLTGSSLRSSAYSRREVTISGAEANIKGTLFGCSAILIFGIPFYLIWKEKLISGSFFSSFWSYILFLSSVIIGMVLHELVHGIFWSFYIKNGFKSIKFGILWKALAPYCHSKEPMKLKHYIIGAIMPAILIGFVPSLTALITGNPGFLLFGIIFSVGAGGDYLMIWLLRKEDKNTYVQDHPSKIGCFIYNRIS